MNTQILLTVVVSMFVCQQVYAQDEAEATELEGTWEMVSHLFRGEHDDQGVGDLWRFKGNILHIRSGRDKPWLLSGTFSVDPSVMPAAIDLEALDAGIYELDGESLTICFDFFTRPDRLESTEGDINERLYVYRRVTEEDDE